MKVRISYTVEVDDEFRRALRRYHGQDGLADRAEIREWYEQNGGSSDSDVLDEYREELRRRAEERKTIAERGDDLPRFRIKGGVRPYGGRTFPGAWDEGRKSATLYVNTSAGNSPMQRDGRTYFDFEIDEVTS